MGIFDIFTGESAKKAAEENRRLLQQNLQTGTGTLRTGQTDALGALDQAGAAYAPLSELGKKYGGGTSLYLDSLGVNGADGNARATGAFRAGPGYDWRVSQSLDGINRAANANGSLVGGNTLAALSDRAGNMADQEFGSWQDRLAGLISPELSATSGAAGGIAGVNTGKAGVFQDTAGKIASLGTNTTNGIAGQNTQEANAITAGSGNLWGLGMNLAKLGVGAMTGGTSMLGSGAAFFPGAGKLLGSMGITYGQPGTRWSNMEGPVG